MDNIEKLKQIGELDTVRQRMGAENESDDSFDDYIKELTNHEIIAKICGWELGDETWWDDMKSQFDYLESLDAENQPT